MASDVATAAALPTAFFDLFERLPDAVAVTRADGHIVAVNANLVALSGHAAAELVGAPIEILVPTRARERHGA